MADLTRKTENLLNNSNFEQGGWDATTGTIPFKNSNSKRCRYSDFFSISSTIIYYDFKDLNVNIIMVDSNGISLGGSGFKTGIGSFALLNNTDKISLIIANTDTTQDITPEDVQSKNISLDYGWVHSLRKQCSATETIQSGDTIYTNGQPISTYSIKGNTVQNGTPTPSNPVAVNGVGERTANLYDYKTAYSAYVQPNGDVTATAAQIYAVQNVYGSGLIGTEVTMSVKVKTCGSTYVSIRAFINGARVDGNTIARGNTGVLKITVTPETESDYWFITYGSGGTDTYSDFMLNTGSTAQSYEPYGFKIPISLAGQTTPVYLTEQLMLISTYADILASSGTVTRNVIKQVFTGQENWDIYSAGTDVSFFYLVLGSAITGRNALIICTHFERKGVDTVSNIVGIDLDSSGTIIRLRPPNVATDYSSTTAWKQWLADQYAAGTPVTVWYVLATPTTETITAPSIPTTDGANSITVDTTVQPSEFSATWTGWHDSSVKEWDGSQWQ